MNKNNLEVKIVKLYVSEKLSARAISELLNVSKSHVLNVVGKYNVTRSSSKAIELRNKSARYITKLSDTKLGVLNPAAKLTEEDVLTIRRLHNSMTQQALATMFNISRNTICDIVNNKTWKHLLK